MPTPKPGESEKDFVSRCMAFGDMQKYDPDQRAAICYSKYSEGQKAMKEEMPMMDMQSMYQDLMDAGVMTQDLMGQLSDEQVKQLHSMMHAGIEQAKRMGHFNEAQNMAMEMVRDNAMNTAQQANGKIEMINKSLDSMAQVLEKEALIKEFEHELLGDDWAVRPEAMEGLFKWYYARMRKDGLSKEEAVEKAKSYAERDNKYADTTRLLKAATTELIKLKKELGKKK